MTRILTLAAALALAAPAAADDAKDLVGTWTMEKAELGGKDILAALKGTKMTISDGGKYVTEAGGKESDKGSFTVDEKKTPKTMDIKSEAAPDLKDKTLPAIYELKADTLTVCYGMDFKTRPAKFESPDKSEVLLVTYKREKK